MWSLVRNLSRYPVQFSSMVSKPLQPQASGMWVAMASVQPPVVSRHGICISIDESSAVGTHLAV